MTDKKQQDVLIGPLAREIREFIDFKRQLGSTYTSSVAALKAFDKFCAETESQGMTPQQLADAWAKPDADKPKYDDGCCVRQLGQYLTETGHPKAFTVPSAKGHAPRQLGVSPGPFAEKIKEFVDHKRAAGRKYITEEFSLKAFDIFCSMKQNAHLTPQQSADAWLVKVGEKSGVNVGMVREFGLYLTMQGSKKSFAIPYASGDMPKPPFAGYTSLFAEGIESFLKAKKSAGLKYRQEVFRLKDFDGFCNEHSDLSPQQLAESFMQSREWVSHSKGKRSRSVIKEFGRYLTANGYSNSFNVVKEYFAAGPYAEEISAFVAFKRSCGYNYSNAEYHLKCFDAFCASEEIAPQQRADKWCLKRGDEHPNTRASRVGPVRVFGKRIGHPKAFSIADDAAQGVTPKPPYLFSENDIDLFFDACARLRPDKKDPFIHIVLPAAFLFMHCMGVRTCELKILMENVDFDTGQVIIVDAKTGDRAVYMSADLSGFLSKYDAVIEKSFPFRKYLFPASVNRPRNDFAKRFSEIWASKVPDVGHGAPRLYDFRHHLLYRNVELCMRNGNDVNALRPYIMKHMGHKLPESFQYYFHLSPPIRKEVSQIKNSLDWMIPDVPEAPYE